MMKFASVAVCIVAVLAAVNTVNAVPLRAAAKADKPIASITQAQLQQIMVAVPCSFKSKGKTVSCALAAISPANAAKYIAPLNGGMKEFGINTCAKVAAFLGNVAQESGNLAWFREFASGAEYQGRLGNNRPGDGIKYKGRGPIQTTGKSNYDLAGKALNLPLLANPALLEQPVEGFRASCFFWKSNGLNEMAAPNTENAFQNTVRKVNGAIIATTRYPNRLAIWKKAKQVLGC